MARNCNLPARRRLKFIPLRFQGFHASLRIMLFLKGSRCGMSFPVSPVPFIPVGDADAGEVSTFPAKER